jgi:hypothetical protein
MPFRPSVVFPHLPRVYLTLQTQAGEVSLNTCSIPARAPFRFATAGGRPGSRGGGNLWRQIDHQFAIAIAVLLAEPHANESHGNTVAGF